MFPDTQRTSRFLKPVLAASLWLGMGSSAISGVVDQQGEFYLLGDSTGSFTASGNYSYSGTVSNLLPGGLVFNQFDPSLGSLDGVDFSLVARASRQAVTTVTINGRGRGSTELQTNGQISFLATTIFATPTFNSMADCDTLTAGTCTDNDGYADSDNQSYSWTGALSPFVGSGTIALDVSWNHQVMAQYVNALGVLEEVSESGWVASSSINGEGLVMTYRFTEHPALPLPASLLLLGAGIAALGYRRRRL